MRRFSLALALAAALAGQGSTWAGAPPLEEVPPLTESLLKQISTAKPVEASVVKTQAGAVQFAVDGKFVPFVSGGVKGLIPREQTCVKVWKETGIPLVYVLFDIGYMSERLSYINPPAWNRSFWQGRDSYLADDIEPVLWRVLQAYPEANIVLWPWIDVYPEWAAENPDELIRNEDGKFLVANNHYQRMDTSADPQSQERFAWSIFSEKFLGETGEAVRRFVQAVEATVPGRRVVGYVAGGGQDAQLYSWEPPNNSLQKDPKAWGDYSAPARRAWNKWLEAKYATTQSLSKAWGQEVASFDDAAPPAAAMLVGPEKFFDPRKEQQCIDWLRFMAEGRSRMAAHFASVIRKAMTRPGVVGVSAGDGGARHALSATYELMTNPEIDILWHQATYGTRLPPSTGGMNAVLASHGLHKKLFLADMDQRTWLTPSIKSGQKWGEISVSDQSVGRAASIEQLRSMWRREVALLFANGGGPMFHPLTYQGAFESPSIKEELTAIRRQADSWLPPAPDKIKGDLVVIYDENSVSLLKGGRTSLHSDWTNGILAELNASGVPYRQYYVEDLKAGLVPPGKIYLFLNLLDLDEPLRKQIEKLQGGGRTFVWLQSTGLRQFADQPEVVSQTVGMSLSPISAISDSDQATTTTWEGLSPQTATAQRFVRDPQFGWKVVDRKAFPLAIYPESNDVAFAWRDHGDWKSVFVGAYTLNNRLINSLSKIAGAWVPVPAGNVMAAGASWISIHPLRSGKVSLHLESPAALQAVAPETLTSPRNLDHELDLAAGTTYWFQLQP